MPHSDSTLACPTSRSAARHLAEALRTQECPTDSAFDRFLPEDLRGVSRQYWTPLRVAARAAEWLDAVNVRHVVDIGSGAGKFCVAAALVSGAHFTGLEKRSSLVASARALADLFGVRRRVRFVHGAFGVTPPPVADAYYFYNPFGNYWFDSIRDTEGDAEFGPAPRLREVALVEQFIRAAPVGTWLITYNGFGGRMPECCDLIRVHWTLSAALRLWRKQRASEPPELARQPRAFRRAWRVRKSRRCDVT
jgi:SAM-dependent methyltransferase